MTGLTPFDTVLVANRGEIACRIIRAVQQAGMRAVAVYSDADATAPHVALADLAVNIGPGPASESYLSPARLLEAAERTGAQAVHPGYGFFSENARFARACARAGLVFIGPDAEAIALMGDKIAARKRMRAAGLACLPGYEGDDQSDKALSEAAARIGFPVMIKAAAGGGGKGMRLVRDPSAFAEALHLARDEARAGFGSDRVLLERALDTPRHVEVQVLADRQGTVVHLGDRDCSVQRRHQKLVEEAPAPGLADDLRAAMGSAAVRAAREIGYEGAGTVEFLLDAKGRFYFLEMNTRLQVEHPVTEMVTGRDLVALQLTVAQGHPLGFAQQDIRFSGHAIEARLCAEDPGTGFLPSSGDVVLWSPPRGDGLRVDAGVETGGTVPPFYDPLVAKIVAHGATREEARRRLIGALRDTVLFGPACNRDFLLTLLRNDEFAAGSATTALVNRMLKNGRSEPAPPGRAETALAAGLWYRARQEGLALSAPWLDEGLLGWSSAGELTQTLWLEGLGGLEGPGGAGKADLRERDGVLRIGLDEDRFDMTGRGAETRIGGQRADLRVAAVAGGVVYVATGARQFALRLRRQPGDMDISAQKEAGDGRGIVRAPMHGALVRLCVAPGDRVNPGDLMAVIEAMKMQHELRADLAGVVTRTLVPEGAQVAAGAALIETGPEEKA